MIKPGISTLDIDRAGERMIRGYGCTPSFKNYNGYPASICVSVNDEVVHGIPNRHRILHEGDIVSLDAGDLTLQWVSFRCSKNPCSGQDPARGREINSSDKGLFF